MKNLFQIAFFKECVIKLGSIYILLFILSFIFIEYRISLSMSWMNGLIFATHDEIAFTIFSLLFVTFSYGFYSWVKAFFNFVFKIQISMTLKIIHTIYLVIAPIIVSLIGYEILLYFRFS